jgi:predicted nucleic acid-binding protein
MPLPTVQERLAPIIQSGAAATCALVDLAVLYSARNHRDHERIRVRRRHAYVQIPMNEAIFERAITVQSELAKRGQHRLPIPDLIVAAAAESAGLTVLHYDADFDRIAGVTHQPVEWVVPRGSV